MKTELMIFSTSDKQFLKGEHDLNPVINIKQ